MITVLHDKGSNRQNKLCKCHMKIYLSLLVRLRESSNGKTCVFREEHISTKLVKKKRGGRRIFLVVGTSVSGVTTMCEMFRKYRCCDINQLGHFLIHRQKNQSVLVVLKPEAKTIKVCGPRL